MSTTLRISLIAAASAAVLVACGGSDDHDGYTPPPAQPPVLNISKLDGRYHHNKTHQDSGFRAISDMTPSAGQAAEIALPALDAQAQAKAQSDSLGGPILIAQPQTVAQAQSPEQLASLLHWRQDAQGQQVAALRVQAAGALGIRLGLWVQALPDAALLRLYPDGGADAQGFETTGAEINAVLRLNAQAGEQGAAARTWWSPDLGGDAVRLEIILPAGTAPEALQLALPSISHRFVDTDSDAALQPAQPQRVSLSKERIPSAGSCNLDMSCYSNGSAERDAVARMSFVRDGKGYFCTGTLLNDAIHSDIPYFLTAHHCISSQTVAGSLQTDWFFRSASCGSPYLDARRTTRTRGARLLYTSNVGQGFDTTLLVLNDAAPAGTYLAGWDARLNNSIQKVLALHHPSGTLGKISGGETQNYANCDGRHCQAASDGRGRYYEVRWGDGTTEAGSSGSALFTQSGHVIGTLHGGTASCSAPDEPDFYGRLDLAFESGLKNFLAAAQRPF
ncbi:MAG: trypsin-like peptidase domain-containing protein [Comamonadaceae bacterium]|nr:trypsin-like peptidase domain-containing protein [Comamonadaceae bacterium]